MAFVYDLLEFVYIRIHTWEKWNIPLLCRHGDIRSLYLYFNRSQWELRRTSLDSLPTREWVTGKWQKHIYETRAWEVREAEVWASILGRFLAYFLPDSLCAWLSDILRDRSIWVIVDNFSLDIMDVNAGVPQESVLSVTLFLLHIKLRKLHSQNNCKWVWNTITPELYGWTPYFKSQGVPVHREKEAVLIVTLVLVPLSDHLELHGIIFSSPFNFGSYIECRA